MSFTSAAPRRPAAPAFAQAGPSVVLRPQVLSISRTSVAAATRDRVRTGSAPRRAPASMVAAEPQSRIWTPHSWRDMPILQVPEYPDAAALRSVEDRLAKSLPLVFSGECDRLMANLAEVSRGKAFVLQGGDCAESFSEFERYGGQNIRDTFTLLVQMSIMMMYGLRRPVVKILRSAGQFAKPRSSPYESAKDQELQLPSYRGDMINGPAFTAEERTPDPERMFKAFVQSTATINLLRTISSGGSLDLHRIHDINLKFVRGTKEGQRFVDTANHIANAIAFMESCGMRTDTPNIRQPEFYTSHESLLLPYEQALCRQDPDSGKWYATSAHMLWIGDRTRQPDNAHVEFLRGISNPIGIKCGPSLTMPELVQLLDILNPHNTPGRITLIVRVGAGKVEDHLPQMIETVEREGRNVVWSCDPCHGNTESSPSGFKTRRFENISEEVREFFATHDSMNSYPGGVHLELTGQNVTECVGGMMQLTDDDLKSRYETHCDPRLNATQALELAFKISESMQNRCFI